MAALVDRACGAYVERIGMLPGPMTLDYTKVIAERQVLVAAIDGTIAGVLVLGVDDEGFVIENVAVHPSLRGRGLGQGAPAAGRSRSGRSGFRRHPPLHTRENDGEPSRCTGNGYLNTPAVLRATSHSCICASL